MGIALRLRAKRPPGQWSAFLDNAEAFFDKSEYRPAPLVARLDEGPVEAELSVELHPAAETLRIRSTGDASLTLEAKTGTAGPGYHARVCALLLEFGEALGLDYEKREDADNTGFWASGDQEALEEVFLDFISGAAAQIIEMSDEGHQGFALSLPEGHIYQHDGVVATALGPRDRAWLEAAILDPEVARDVFPDWEAGAGARYFLGLALTRMWRDVRFRPPVDEEERALQLQVVDWLELAHGLDPSLPYPWRQWSELLVGLEEQSLRATRAHLKAQSHLKSHSEQARADANLISIGYRLQPVRVLLSGGWSLQIPGEMAEKWDERGTFSAWDEGRNVYFNSLTARPESASPSAGKSVREHSEETLAGLPELEGDEILEFERENLKGLGTFNETQVEGETYQRLEAHAAMGPHAAVGTLLFKREEDRQWALTTWASLQRF